MRFAGLLLSAALFAAGAAWADAPDHPETRPSPQPAAPRIPQSIWRIAPRKSAEHLQSGLSCPVSLYDYGLTSLQVYDAFGLDVSCGYADRGRVLTIYVMKAPKAELAQIYESSKAAIAKVSPQLHPALVSEDQPVQGELAWRRATFAEDGGQHTALWMAKLQGWFVQYRATYPAVDEASVNAALSKMTDLILASAGAHLKLCSAVAAPARTGVALTDAAEVQKLATMSSLIGAAGQVAASQGKGQEAKPVIWCADDPVPQGSIPLLAWRGVHDDGEDAGLDRITAMTMGPSPEMVVGPDSLPNLTAALTSTAGAAPDRWTASVQRGAQTWIFAYFDGRPATQAVAALFAAALQGRVNPVAGFSASGKDVVISVPSAPKP